MYITACARLTPWSKTTTEQHLKWFTPLLTHHKNQFDSFKYKNKLIIIISKTQQVTKNAECLAFSTVHDVWMQQVKHVSQYNQHIQSVNIFLPYQIRFNPGTEVT